MLGPDGAAGARVGADLAANQTIDVGDQIGRLQLRERIGAGGMGVVFVAHDPALAREVAVKVLRPDPTVHLDHGRLLREAQALGQLRHPNVVAVHDVGSHEGLTYLEMDYIRGRTFTAWLAEQARTPEAIAAMLAQAGQGIVAAHEAGLLHRDIKPSNLLIDENERAVVVDFGLARSAETSASPRPTAAAERLLDTNLTDPHWLVGTPRYMAPELLDGQGASVASDQFAFAVTLFEALRGHPPFAGRTPAELRAAMKDAPRLPLAGVSAPLRTVLRRGLDLDPARRFPSMKALVETLALAVDHRQRVRKRRLGMLGIAVAVGLSGAAYAGWSTRPPAATVVSDVDRLAGDANAAAARGRFVYPSPDAPDEPTAFGRVLALEDMEAPLAQERAQALRLQFAGTLTELGDRYWPIEGARGFALDYYVQALVFDPDAEAAGMRSGMTEGQRISVTQRAEQQSFSRAELVAAEPLIALAEPDDARRTERLQEVTARRRKERPAMQHDALIALLEPQPPARPAAAGTKPKPTPEPEPESVEVEVEPEPEPEAAAKAEPAPAGDPSSALAAGRAALKSRDYAAAERSFRRALSIAPRSSAAMIGLADSFFERGNYARALRYCKKAVALAPRNGAYHRKLGDAYYRADRYRDAEKAYARAVELGASGAKKSLERMRRLVHEP